MVNKDRKSAGCDIIETNASMRCIVKHGEGIKRLTKHLHQQCIARWQLLCGLLELQGGLTRQIAPLDSTCGDWPSDFPDWTELILAKPV